MPVEVDVGVDLTMAHRVLGAGLMVFDDQIHKAVPGHPYEVAVRSWTGMDMFVYVDERYGTWNVGLWCKVEGVMERVFQCVCSLGVSGTGRLEDAEEVKSELYWRLRAKGRDREWWIKEQRRMMTEKSGAVRARCDRINERKRDRLRILKRQNYKDEDAIRAVERGKIGGGDPLDPRIDEIKRRLA